MRILIGFAILFALINTGFSLWEQDLKLAAAWVSAGLGWLVALMGTFE